MVLSRVVYEIAGGEGLLPLPRTPPTFLAFGPSVLSQNKNLGYALGSGLERPYEE